MADSFSVEAIMYGLRTYESGGNYTARNPGSSATGAYQYIRDTWRGYGGYAEAALAPPSVQDARARSDMLAAFSKYGAWDKAVASHYYPDWANNRALWWQSPRPPQPSILNYVNQVLAYARSYSGTEAPVEGGGGVPGGVLEAIEPVLDQISAALNVDRQTAVLVAGGGALVVILLLTS